MIEHEIIKQYPSLVARPYLLIKDDFQRKDMQRFWFENTISFLAVLSAAELVKYYKRLKSKEEKSEKDLEIIKSLQEHKSLTMVGLEHMALGKWVMMLRETTKFLQELGAATTIPELVEFYHGKNGKNNAKTIDKLVSIRNDDAHGNPIPEDKLNAELDKRQKLIDLLLEELSFLSDYRLILPEKLEIEGSKQFYMCKQFIGSDIVNTKQTFEFSPQISEVMLINQSKKDEYLSLNPLLLYLGVQNDENDFLGIFSKYSSKDGTEAKYLNLDGSGTIDLVNFGQSSEVDLIADRQSYNEIYSDPESFQVNLNVEMKFEESSINIKEESSFSLLIDNKKSTDIKATRVVLDIPKNIDIIEIPKTDEVCTVELIDSQLIVKFNNFENDQKIEIAPLKYTISEQGSYSLDGGRVLYEYYRTLADKESGQLTEEEIQFEGVAIEAQDPNSRDKMVPVVNINKGFVDEDGNPIQNVRIGENFIYKVVVTNIGFSSAKNVTIDLVFPDNINLKQGKETITLGQLNPFEVKTFKYVLSSHLPDIYTITMQNVLYTDSQNTRYSTRCSDEHFIIVRSDLVKEFVYDIKDHIEDLYIDDMEKENIHSMIESLSASISVDAKQTYRDAETEAVIKIVRDMVEKTVAKKELQVVEKIYEEGKRDRKITNSETRKFLVFSCQEMPFFAINLSKGYEPEFFALRTNIDKRFDKVTLKQAVVKEGSYTLDHSINFSDIKYDAKYGKAFFAQWLNIVLTKFSKEYIIWKNCANNIGKVYGGPLSYVSGMLFKNFENSNNASNESGVDQNYVLIDRDNSQNYYISFRCNLTQNYKNVMLSNMDSKSYFTYLNRTSGKDRVRLYNAKNLSFYMQPSDSGKATKFPAISLPVRNEESIGAMMEKTRELWDYLCLSHSLDIFYSDNFKDQQFIEEMTGFVDALFAKGFALRINSKDKNMLDIYPLKYFKPHTASERDCIGFIKKYHSGWQIFLDFFVDEVDDVLADELSLITGNTILDKVRWIKLDIKSIEQFNMVTEVILKQTEHYKANKLAIWPSKMQRDMILNHGQTDSGFFIVLKNILSGINNYHEILEDFKSMSLDKELDRTLKRSELFPIDAGYESPLFVEGEDENKVIHFNPAFEDTLRLLYEEDPSFNYLEEGPALFRIQTKLVSQKYEYLAYRAPYNSGMVDNAYKANNKYFKVCWFTLNPLKDKRMEFSLVFYDCGEEVDTVIEKTYANLNNKFNNELVFGRSGRKDQHIKVTYIYSFDNFDNELKKMQTICCDFFSEAEQGIENIN